MYHQRCFHILPGKSSLLPNPPHPFLGQLSILHVLAAILPSFLIPELFCSTHSHDILNINLLYKISRHSYCIGFPRVDLIQSLNLSDVTHLAKKILPSLLILLCFSSLVPVYYQSLA